MLSRNMDTGVNKLNIAIETELRNISNQQVVRHVRSLLVQPRPVLLDWDYGEISQQYPCWIVLEETAGNLGIAFANEGFGPQNPWGLVSLKGTMSMGMDSAWYPSFMQAYIESAALEIPVWRIAKEGKSGLRCFVTGEGAWDLIWA